jgi:hypothetical protein
VSNTAKKADLGHVRGDLRKKAEDRLKFFKETVKTVSVSESGKSAN